ncbi:MAG: nucleotide pyrophosphohydrolase [Burkholderiales bacterium]
MPPERLDVLRDKLRAFVTAREWDQFHNPKNLVMAVAGEAAELMEHFQWLTLEESVNLPAATKAEVELEIADVLLLLLRLCDKLDVDPISAAERKLVLNEVKYPAEKSRGRALKYTKL